MTPSAHIQHSENVTDGMSGARSVIRVAIIDAHDLLRRGLAALVNTEPGMKVCAEISEARLALASIVQLRPNVVLLDVCRGAQVALSLIKSIRRFDPHIAIVALSMYDDAEVVRPVIAAGASGCVLKTDFGNRLLASIRQAAIPSSSELEAVRLPRAALSIRAPSVSAQHPLSMLDEPDRTIATMVGNGLQSRTIAVRLGKSVGEIEESLRRIRETLGLSTAVALVEYCAASHHRDEKGAAMGR